MSAVVFNALIIIFLIPLALRGIAFKPIGAAALLQRHLLVYGLGGIVVPFVGIKIIDLLLVALHRHLEATMTSASAKLATVEPDKPVFLASLAGKALGMLAVLTLLTGVLYPLLVTCVAQAAFSHHAGGSLVVREGKVVGSRLIGQPFEDPKYFWGRLSATSPVPYNGGASSGSNLGPTNQALTKSAQGRIEALRAADPGNAASIPVDLVTASGSGLDPHITPAAASYQAGRVARARRLNPTRVQRLVEAHTEPRSLGILGRAHRQRLAPQSRPR